MCIVLVTWMIYRKIGITNKLNHFILFVYRKVLSMYSKQWTCIIINSYLENGKFLVKLLDYHRKHETCSWTLTLVLAGLCWICYSEWDVTRYLLTFESFVYRNSLGQTMYVYIILMSPKIICVLQFKKRQGNNNNKNNLRAISYGFNCKIRKRMFPCLQ